MRRSCSFFFRVPGDGRQYGLGIIRIEIEFIQVLIVFDIGDRLVVDDHVLIVLKEKLDPDFIRIEAVADAACRSLGIDLDRLSNVARLGENERVLLIEVELETEFAGAVLRESVLAIFLDFNDDFLHIAFFNF